MEGRTPDGWDIVESLLRTRGSVDHVLVSVADSFGIGIATVTADGRVAWSDTAYELHGRPRIDEVHTVEDAAMGVASVDGARLRAAYWLSSETPQLTLDYSVPSKASDYTLTFRNLSAGVAGFYRGEDTAPASQRATPSRPAPEPTSESPAKPTQSSSALSATGRSSTDTAEYAPDTTRLGASGSTTSVQQTTQRRQRHYEIPLPSPRNDDDGTSRPRADESSPITDPSSAPSHGPSRAERVLEASPDLIMVIDIETFMITMMLGDTQARPPILEHVSAGSSAVDARIHPDDQKELARWWAELDTLQDHEVRHFEVRTWVEREWVWRDIRASVFSRDTDGLPSEALVIIRDVHEQMEYLRLLQDSEKLWRIVFHDSPVGLAVIDGDGYFSSVNDAFCDTVNRARDTVLSLNIAELVGEDIMAADGGFPQGGELSLLLPNGTEAWVRIRTRTINYMEEPHTLLTLEDITVAKASEEQMRYAALHNPLSGLPNRDLFGAELHLALNRANRNQTQVAVLFIDLDGLRMVNNSEGHQAGDQLVRVAAERLRTAFRTSDLVAHRGGDEFLVLCDEVDGAESVKDLAERAITVLREPVLVGDELIPISASVGAALSIHGKHTSDEIERMADLAMYQAKDMGGGSVVVHDPQGVPPLLDLAGALDRGELRVHYRPVYTLETNAVAGFDAVLHWRRGDQVVPPEEIADALLDPSAKPVLHWMISQSVQDIRVCLPDHVEQLTLWLPTSRSALNRGTAQAAYNAMSSEGETTSASPTLVFTMSEGEVDRIGKPSQVQRRLNELFSQGPIAFGVTKYTPELLPMSLLRRLPAKSVTIDPMVIAATMTDPTYSQFVAGIVSALNAGGTVTIASGVNSPELLNQVRQLGIAAVHGDLLGTPYPLMTYTETITIPHPAVTPEWTSTGAAPASWQRRYSASDHIDLRDPTSPPEPESNPPRFIGDELAQEFGFNLGDDPNRPS